MKNYLEEAKEELRRADHLLYVSLKYTRTVDILKSLVERLIACMDRCIMAILKLNVVRGRIPEIPKNVIARIETVNNLYPSPTIASLLNFYQVMRKLDKAEPVRSNEFRRGVRMNVILDDIVLELDIDNAEEYFKLTEMFFRITTKLVELAEKGLPEPSINEITTNVNIDLEFERG